MPLVEDDHEDVDSKAAFLSVDTMVCYSLLRLFSFKSLAPPLFDRFHQQNRKIKEEWLRTRKPFA